ncbi:hypothetical protein RJ55_00984 [Drechmeria coniospora]|nr:hypothetical protein RJ55_00984 [Drechmeria coniospora]
MHGSASGYGHLTWATGFSEIFSGRMGGCEECIGGNVHPCQSLVTRAYLEIMDFPGLGVGIMLNWMKFSKPQLIRISTCMAMVTLAVIFGRLDLPEISNYVLDVLHVWTTYLDYNWPVF